MTKTLLCAAAVLLGGGSALAAAPLPPHFDTLAGTRFEENLPTPATVRLLNDELQYQRATQVYLWALPILNMMAMKEGSERAFGAGYHVLPVWKQRLAATTRITTPNADLIYALGYLDVGKDGPLVVEVPPKLQGLFDDFWQRPLQGSAPGGVPWHGDVGFFGPDRGQGGKYLILPPDYSGPVPDGHFVYRSRTANVFLFWRAFYQDPSNLRPAIDLIEGTRIYPLGRREAATPMRFPDASAVDLDMIMPRDSRAFEMLQRFVDSEVADAVADADWRGMLAAIGIVKGRKFAPDARTRAILDRAAQTAWKMSKVVSYANARDWEGARVFADRQWIDPNLDLRLDLDWLRTAGDYRDLDARIAMFASYYSLSPAMVSRQPGLGARYFVGMHDADGAFLRGGKPYRLHLPAGIPVANYWSLAVYDADDAGGLDNGQPFPTLGSRDAPQANADGSIDLWLGPEAPEGRERNWIRTVPGRGWFAIIRLYGPKAAAFDGSWKPGDFEAQK